MRALRVVGLTEDGEVLLEDPVRLERFRVPADERLRAAARGDLSRLGDVYHSMKRYDERRRMTPMGVRGSCCKKQGCNSPRASREKLRKHWLRPGSSIPSQFSR